MISVIINHSLKCLKQDFFNYIIYSFALNFLFQAYIRYCIVLLIYLVLSMKQGGRSAQSQQRNKHFLKIVQAGDISLYNLFKDAIAMFGYTKVGKTASCHILANSPLRAELQNGELIYKATSQRYSHANIGNSNQSQTEMPNIFQTKYRSNGILVSVTLLDQPGYGDSYGFHRIFSSGYFHYRTFSKTPRLKFILAFKKDDLRGTAEKFKGTISNFINTFSNYKTVKGKILNASVFLVTNVPPKSSIQDIYKSLEELKERGMNNLTPEDQINFKYMITHMITNKKIFIIEKPEQVNHQTRENDLLRQISEKTVFWERNMKGDNQVEMQQINFSVANQVLNSLTALNGNIQFRNDFYDFKNYMNQRIQSILFTHKYSLKNIIQALKKDILTEDAPSFLQGMSTFNETYYDFLAEYRESRQRTEGDLFALPQLEKQQDRRMGIITTEIRSREQREREDEMKSTYFMRQFQVLECVITSAQKAHNIPLDRTVKWLQTIKSVFFLEVFRKMNLLRVERGDSESTIYKYSYAVTRLVQECKIITLILFSNLDARNRFDQIQKAMIDIAHPLKDRMLIQFSEIQISSLKRQFLQKLDFSKIPVNFAVFKFLEEDYRPNFDLTSKVIQFLVRYAERLITRRKKNSSENEMQFIAEKLFKYRCQCFEMLQQQCKQSDPSKLPILQYFIVTLNKQLGSLLLTYFERPSLAREVFQSTNNADLVFQSFQAELKRCKPIDKRQILIDYGKYAREFCRNQLSLKCLQEAYTLCESKEHINQVSDAIAALENDNQYLKKFHNRQFCEPLSEETKAEITKLCKQQGIKDKKELP